MENTPKKKILSLLLAFMVIGSAVFANGIDNPTSASGVAIIKNGTTFKLYYKGNEQSNVKVSIIDANNKVVFTEVLRNTDGFVRPYNVSYLSEGEYKVELTDRHNTHTQNLSIHKDENEKLAHLFKVGDEDGKYMLTVSNKEAGDITVKIFDGSDTLIYSQVEQAGADFARIYNLKKYNGKFTFEVTDNNGKSKSISH